MKATPYGDVHKHHRPDDYCDYCGVGACVVCMVTFERTGLYPHGDLMLGERTLTISLRPEVFEDVLDLNPRYRDASERIIFKASVCNECGARDALAEAYPVDDSMLEVAYS